MTETLRVATVVRLFVELSRDSVVTENQVCVRVRAVTESLRDRNNAMMAEETRMTLMLLAEQTVLFRDAVTAFKTREKHVTTATEAMRTVV